MTSAWLHERSETSSADEADAVMRRLYEDGSLRRRSQMVSFRHRLDGTPTSHISRFEFGGAFESAGVLHDAICVIQTIRGRYEWEAGDERGTGDTIELCQPGVLLNGRTDNAETRVLTITLDELARQAAVIYGQTPDLRFDGATPVSEGLQRVWSFAVDLAEQSLQDPELDEFPLVRATVERQLVVTTLEAFRSRAAGLAPRRIDAAAIRRAQSYIDHHAHEPITIDDIALHVGVPTAALEAAYRAHTGHTITDTLRRARVAGALDELTHLNHPAVPNDVVRRWGFRDVAHFTAAVRTHQP